MAAFATGILAGAQAEFAPAELAAAGGTFLALALLCRWRRFAKLQAVCLLLAFAVAGIAVHALRRPAAPDLGLVFGRPSRIEGCVVSGVTGPADRPWFLLEVGGGARIRTSYNAKAQLAPPPLRAGQRIEAELTLRAPQSFRNPGSFDYGAWLAARNIFWQGRLTPRKPVTVLPGECGSAWANRIASWRAAALRRVDQIYPDSGYNRGMMKGLLLGDTSEIRRVWVDDFRRTGTYHALVISGSHVSILAGLFLLWLRWSRLGELGVLGAACALAWLYALVAGGDAPVVRSAAGFTVAMAARLVYRRTRLVNVLALVALVFLFLEPAQLFEASFQLSFLAVAAIAALGVPLLERTSGVLRGALRDFTVEGAPRPLASRTASALRVELLLLAETVHLVTRAPVMAVRRAMAASGYTAAWIWDLALVSAAVQLALVLPMVYYFHRLSVSGLTANVLATPLLTLAIPFGFLALLTGWGWAAFAASGLLDISRRIVSWHADWEPQWRIPDPPVWLAVLFAAAVLLLCAGLRYRWRANWVVTGACLTLLGVIAIHPFGPNAVPRFLELTAIDVGQGESLMLALPEGGVVLVDTGGLAVFGSEEPPRLDTGEDVVAPYLWSRGFRRIDALALSHIHQDHAGGAPALIENFRPAELWIGERADSALWRRIEAAARAAGTRIRFLRSGDTIHLGGARFDTLAPREWEFPPAAGGNEDSMLLRVSYGRHRLLLTGDLGRRMERQLLDAGEPGRIDVLKVAHHGSRRSSHPDFLDVIRPAVAIISAGFENPFRLPSPAVVADLKSRGVMVLRTDLDGLVTTRSDGRRLEVDGVRFHNSGN